MRKIKTTKELKRTFAFSLIPMILCLGIICTYITIKQANLYFSIVAVTCYGIALFTLIIMAIEWGLNNKIDRGIKYAIRHYRLIHSLDMQLLDANIFTEVRFGSLKLAKLPCVSIDFDKDFKQGTVYIKNSVNFHEKLKKLDISSALKQYVIEQIYITANRNYYFFDFYDASIERRITFNTLEKFKEYANKQETYEIFIDSFISVPLSHCLLAGATRSGKSYALMCFLLQFLMKEIPYHLYFIDMKYDSTSMLGQEISPENTAEEFDDIVIVLEKFVEAMKERQIEIKLMKKRENLTVGDYSTFSLSPHILVFDEYASFISILKTKEKKQRDYVESIIHQIVLMGAGLGFFIFIIAQKSGAEIVPTHIRDNLLLKLVLGNAENTTYQTAFGIGVEIPDRKFEKGEGVFTYSGIANKVKLCSFSTLNFDIHKAFQKEVGYCKYPTSSKEKEENDGA